MNEEITADALMLLGITDPTQQQEKTIEFIVNDTAEAVKAYCRIDFVPAQLFGLISQMTVKQYRTFGYGLEETPTEVKSISEGGRSISFSEKTASGLLNDYKSRLKPFINRKGRVPSELQ